MVTPMLKFEAVLGKVKAFKGGPCHALGNCVLKYKKVKGKAK